MGNNLAYLPEVNSSEEVSDSEPKYYVYDFEDVDGLSGVFFRPLLIYYPFKVFNGNIEVPSLSFFRISSSASLFR